MSKENEKLRQKLHVLGWFIILTGFLMIAMPFVLASPKLIQQVELVFGIISVGLGLYLAS